MPPSPEFRDALRFIRIAEIFRNRKAKDRHQSDRHIRVTGKIKINLKHKCQYSKPCGNSRQLRRIIPGHSLKDHSRLIGKQYFFSKSAHKPHDAVTDTFDITFALPKLHRDIRKTHDRPCDQLRKCRNISSKIDRISLSFCLSTVNIDRVGHGLKRIKRNTDRQCKFSCIFKYRQK